MRDPASHAHSGINNTELHLYISPFKFISTVSSPMCSMKYTKKRKRERERMSDIKKRETVIGRIAIP